mmetsp:Transcript_27835/g.91540  ORF Transcript_27835/g.91540 Transcript_27835/m.91540 type:complete len:218 (-) Transcript_27835:24-677(-)
MARRQPVRLLPRLRRLLLCHVLPVCRRGAAGAAVLADARRREGPKVQGDRRDPLRAVCVHQHLQQDLLGELHRCHSRVHAVRARDPRLLRRPDLRGRPATPSRRTRALALQSARGCLLRRLLSPDLLPPPRRSREDPPAAAHPALLLRRGDGRLLPRLLLHPLRDLPHHARASPSFPRRHSNLPVSHFLHHTHSIALAFTRRRAIVASLTVRTLLPP